MDTRRRSSITKLVNNLALERAQSWLKANKRKSLPGPSSLGPITTSESSFVKAQDLIEHHELRNDASALNLVVLHRLPQSTITSTHLARFFCFQNAPRYQGLSGGDIETIYKFLKAKPQLYYNPWKKLLGATGKKSLNKDELQQMLQQLEPAKKYQECVRAHGNLMYNSELIVKGCEDLIALFSSCGAGLGFEGDEEEMENYEAECAMIDDLLIERRLAEARGEVENADFWGAEDWSSELGHPAFRRKGYFGVGVDVDR